MGQSVERDFKVLPTAVSTWGPRIPPAVGIINDFNLLTLIILKSHFCTLCDI